MNIQFLGKTTILVTRLKGFVCLHASKPNKMRTGVCSKESKGLFKKMVSSLETQEGWHCKTWLLDGSMGTDYIWGKIVSHGSWGHGLY